jgi:UDP-N-acetylglucosamine diphosphorylase / glucose-1-phosphate thymidylyltransferase / UDP-N-acetylgalactosamine diphosphorylase / glucosamine-1-phosphate N-acetyltransferase / galactosamine-1-phosphate N-acetyltransferase
MVKSEQFQVDKFFDLSSFAHKELFEGCTYVWQALEKIQNYLSRKTLGKIESAKQEYAYLVNPELISIGEGTTIEPGAYIKGPCIIGAHCHIRQGAYIRGDVIIGDHVVVGHASEIKHSILLNHAHAVHFAYVGDSIIGNHVNLGAGTKCANLRLDGTAIILHEGTEAISTGQRKLGAIIGDHCQVGCNVVLNPGSLLQKNVQIYPCLNAGGLIKEKSIVKPQSKPVIHSI